MLDGGDHDVSVKLGLGGAVADAARGRVHELGGMQVRGRRRHRCALRGSPARRQLDVLAQVAERVLDRGAVRLLDLGTLLIRSERPRDRHAVGRRERHVDPRRARPVRAGRAEELLGSAGLVAGISSRRAQA